MHMLWSINPIIESGVTYCPIYDREVFISNCFKIDIHCQKKEWHRRRISHTCKSSIIVYWSQVVPSLLRHVLRNLSTRLNRNTWCKISCLQFQHVSYRCCNSDITKQWRFSFKSHLGIWVIYINVYHFFFQIRYKCIYFIKWNLSCRTMSVTHC